MFLALPLDQITHYHILKKGEKTMKLNIYKNQHEVEKIYEIDNYDLMYGTVEDILGIFDEIEDLNDNMQIFKVIQKNRMKLNDLLKDIFPDLTEDEMRRIKLKELVPVFMELFTYVQASFSQKN
jgi:hypothetical protein